MERAVRVLRRTKIAQARVRFGSEAFQQCRRKPRFANACFTGKEHYLAFAGLCFRPAAQQQFEFFFPSYKLREAARVKSLEAAFDCSRSQRSPCPHVAIGGDHDDGDVRSQCFGLGQEFTTVHPRHVDVGED
jgi:hypothetical protein